ncbi:MAG: phosphoribosylamine--glycine ligase [Flavobacteriales bacterium]|jgi:phosphoribosylamine--glycine ligase|nr:phosphoribosylamine--glycine ligase [Flavobacteriales bacterium]|tara:strand:- start:296 stop:1582 length:1287 start_codon:yes stop_codon:yes gene_type:complete
MNKLNVLILGSGGREHAIAWKIHQSPILNKLYVAPGNSGTLKRGENLDVNIHNYDAIKNCILTQNINLLIIGPEDPLVNGLHDQLEDDKDIHNLIIIGPKKSAAQLEGSKSFAKKFMLKNNIPTADFKSFNITNLNEAKIYLEESSPPFVIKADGLAAGKGVFICETLEKATNVVEDIVVNKKFGAAGEKIVIESFLDGIELSVFVLTNGTDYKILPTAKDYKRIGENDTGLNTGGMGAISPVPFVDEVFMEKIKTKIIEPTLIGLKKENIEYTGFIFFGLIKVKNEPFVIEYNVRLGDPETQAIIPRIKSDLLSFLASINDKQTFKNMELNIEDTAATTVILTSGGYPEKYKKGYPIRGLENITNSIAFHAGLKLEKHKYLTNGGRVVAITTVDKNIPTAIKKTYTNIEKISFQDMYFRKDIGNDLI